MKMRLKPGGRAAGGLEAPLTVGALPLSDALHVQSAEFWLALGLFDRAARELEAVSSTAARHPWTLRIQWAVISALTFA